VHRASSYAGFLIRHFREDDIPSVVRLLAAVELIDRDGEETTEKDLHAQLGWANHDPFLDRWVVKSPHDGGITIGYALVWAKTQHYAGVFVATHPSYRRRGLGTELAGRALDRAAALGAGNAGAYASTMNAAASAFLYTLGFRAVSSYWDLLVPSEMSIPDPTWPDGYTVRTFEEVGEEVGANVLLVRVLNHSYQDLWGHGLWMEDAADGLLSDLSSHRIFMVFAPDGKPAAICRFASRGSEKSAGHIDAPGVAPEHRAAGLHVPLLLTALQTLRQDRAVPVRLESWGDDPAVVTAYRDLGLSTLRHAIAFGIQLPRNTLAFGIQVEQRRGPR